VSTALAFSALLMGLAGGPHCAAMCGAACAGLVRSGPARVTLVPAGARLPAPGLWQFHAGRLLGYSAAGAVAAQAVQGFGWLAGQTAALRPLWTFFHLVVLGWGLALLVLARQPEWASAAGRSIWSRVRPWAGMRGGVFTVGALWALMPCGLLYSALLVASLSGGALDGALSMALFAAGSALSLALAPGLLLRLREAGNQVRQDWGTRASGLLLASAALWALWMDLGPRIALWCGLAA
jgi:sulfite exporter TauE/SafE